MCTRDGEVLKLGDKANAWVDQLKSVPKFFREPHRTDVLLVLTIALLGTDRLHIQMSSDLINNLFFGQNIRFANRYMLYLRSNNLT